VFVKTERSSSMGNAPSMDDELINLKMTSKQLIMAHKKCFKNEKKQLSDVKKAVKQGNKEGARIYAQNAIREKTQAMNYLRLSSRVDAVASRLETAIRTKQVRPGPLLIPRTNG
jgi:charged multivesicular body protein 1